MTLEHTLPSASVQVHREGTREGQVGLEVSAGLHTMEDDGGADLPA